MKRLEIDLANPNSSLLYGDVHWTRILHDPAYREGVEREAAQLRAEAVRETVKVMGRGIRAVFVGAFRFFAMIAEGSAAVRLYEELSRLDDATLAELGLDREGIGRHVVDSMGGAPDRVKARLAAIEGGRHNGPAKTEDLPQRRAA